MLLVEGFSGPVYSRCTNQISLRLSAINAASARSHGGAGLSPLGLASTAALSPSNDFVKNYPGAPDSVVELHTGPVCNTWHASV